MTLTKIDIDTKLFNNDFLRTTTHLSLELSLCPCALLHTPTSGCGSSPVLSNHVWAGPLHTTPSWPPLYTCAPLYPQLQIISLQSRSLTGFFPPFRLQASSQHIVPFRQQTGSPTMDLTVNHSKHKQNLPIPRSPSLTSATQPIILSPPSHFSP